MNILFVNTSRSWGGNEKWTRMAAHQLAEKNNVFLAYRSETLGRRFNINKKKLLFMNRADVFTLHGLTKYIKDSKIDVLVSTNRKYYLLGGIASRLGRCLHFVRCGIVWKVPENLYHRHLFTGFIDGIIVNAASIKLQLLNTSFIQEHKVHIIYNGLDLDKLKEAKKTKTPAPFAYTIVSSGELNPRKGHDLVIKGFARFVAENRIRDAGLIILGQGRQKKELKALAGKLGVADRVIFPGFLDNPYPVLATSNLYVAMSANEGISNALLEAMYLGMVVISTPAGGAEDVISHGVNGFLTDFKETDNLSRLLSRVYFKKGFDPDKLVHRARQTVLNHFSLEKMAWSLLELLNQEIEARKHRSYPYLQLV